MPAGPPKTGRSRWEVWRNVVYSQLNTKCFQNNQENTYSWTSWFIPHRNRESAHFEVCGWFKNTVDFPGGSDSKESTCNAGDQDSIPWSEKNPWRWEWLPTPTLLPGKSTGQRNLVRQQPMKSQRGRHDWATKQINKTALQRGFSPESCGHEASDFRGCEGRFRKKGFLPNWMLLESGDNFLFAYSNKS